MTLRRTYLIYTLLGLSVFGACDDSTDTQYDSGVFPAQPGTLGGMGSTAGTQGGMPGTQGGISGTQGSPGTQGGISGTQGGMPGTQGGLPGTQGGTAGTTAGTTGGTTAGTTGGTTAGTTGGTTAGTTGGTTGGTPGGNPGGSPGGTAMCPGLPNVTNYDMPGPFADVMVQDVPESGAGEGCTLFRPGASLGKDGFKHPIAVWGNGIVTTPDLYTSTLTLFASHGFVTIACNSWYPERPCLNDCMEWLIKQNDSGPMAGKLDTSKELTMGYSWGGGASIDTADRPNVKATVSFHGMPPRGSDPWGAMKSPLLLFTSTGDNFVSADGYVTPNYNSSLVPTFYATLNDPSADHLYIIDAGSVEGAQAERGPAIAWFRYWACGDENAKKLFFGGDCTLCKEPWTTQKKPASAWQ